LNDRSNEVIDHFEQLDHDSDKLNDGSIDKIGQFKKLNHRSG
jgi:hypothetical protein